MPRTPWTLERRRETRQPVPVPLHVRLDDVTTPLAIRELSARGMVFESAAPLQAGQRVTCSLETAGGAIGPIGARVAHSRLVLGRRPGDVSACFTGVAFDAIGAADAERLAALLAELERHQPPPSPRLP